MGYQTGTSGEWMVFWVISEVYVYKYIYIYIRIFK